MRPNAIAPFFKQLIQLQSLVTASASTESAWNERIPPEIAPAAGKLKVAAFASLMRQAKLGGSELLKQFVYGFPLVGSLSQQHGYPFDKKAAKASLLAQDQLLSDSSARFFGRSQKSGRKNGPPLWEEATQQRRDGWLTSLSPYALQALLSHSNQLPATLLFVLE